MHFVTLALIILAFGLPSGCKKKGAAEATAGAGAAKAGGGVEQEIDAAFAKKDYEAVLAIMLRARQTASTPDQQRDYTILAHSVKLRLTDVAATDQKAAQVLTTLRAMTLGR